MTNRMKQVSPEKKKNDVNAIVSKWQEAAEEEKRLSMEHFAKKVSFHGFKNIAEEENSTKSKYRKIVWILIIAACFAFLVIWLSIRLVAFFEYNTTFSERTIYVQHEEKRRLNFPAVTICNLNSFRLSKTYELGLHPYIEDLYDGQNKPTDGSNPLANSLIQIDNTNYSSVQTLIGHQFEDMVARCQWKSERCSPNMWKRIITNMGECYTFTAPDTNIRDVGNKYGLSLSINAEQYENMAGTNVDTGIKDYGISLPPGRHSSVAIKRKKTNRIEYYPYSTCGKMDIPISNCHIGCWSSAIYKELNCIPAYMIPYAEEKNKTDCSFRTTVTKIPKLERKLNNKKDKMCNCVLPCKEYKYEHDISQSAPSLYNLQKISVESDAQMQNIANKFQRAKEVHEKANAEYFKRDKALLQHVLNKYSRMKSWINRLESEIQNKSSTEYAKAYNLPDIHTLTPELFYADEKRLKSLPQKLDSETKLTIETASRALAKMGDKLRNPYHLSVYTTSHALHQMKEKTVELDRLLEPPIHRYLGEKFSFKTELHRALTNEKLIKNLKTMEDNLESPRNDIKSRMNEMTSMIVELHNILEKIINRNNISRSIVKDFELIKWAEKHTNISTDAFAHSGSTRDEFHMAFWRLLKLAFLGTFHQISIELHDLKHFIDDDVKDALEDFEEDAGKFVKSLDITNEFFRDNFLHVEVYYKDLTFVLVKEVPSFEFGDLLAEVGGFMGLFMGASILTIIEMIDYFSGACSDCLSRRKEKRKKQDNKSWEAANPHFAAHK